ncbi:unnamed protein product [Microthlaspi erraticum]|uniref:RNase H type-1 domain-containing protein n=1 Tax=Microthlaspi erraticum TaxID=1685480 RepID=A0A6D2I7C8_9BRAS|nr:unnamed protein product [Microthlaspi erraticum]
MLFVILSTEILLTNLRVVFTTILNCDLEPQFDEPYLATSPQQFWGRRWNLVVSATLRAGVYAPVRRVCDRLMSSGWARSIGILAAFLVSGLFHELTFFYVTRETPTWEITWFFVLHGLFTAVEVTVKRRKILQRWWPVRHPHAVSRLLTMAFFLVTGAWLFLTQLIRCNPIKRGVDETLSELTLPHIIVQQAQADVLEWLKSRDAQHSRVQSSGNYGSVSSTRDLIWQWPSLGFHKCNFDASYDLHSNLSMAGWIIRDHTGVAFSWGTTNLGMSSSPLEAEAKALLIAMQQAWSLGLDHVIFEGDCKTLIDPILPSYLPWTPPQKNLPSGSCEGYFGNGFTRRVDFLRPRGGEGSWFRCFYSETLKSSICEGRNVRMVPDRIVMSKGGEKLEEVMGRKEEDELPEFREGAFEVAEEISRLSFNRNRRIGGGGSVISRRLVNEYIEEGGIKRHTMRDLVGSIRAVGTEDFVCEEWVEEPTLLVTRFEYANLYHTVTDWYSAYVSSRVTGLPNLPHVVFIDGHCTTQLEETWTALFSGIRYAKNFSKPLSVFRSTTSVHNVLFVRREDYLAHPRHGGRVQSRLINEEEVFDSLHRWVASGSTGLAKCRINLVNGLLAHMTMKDQVRAIQDASVIIGAHGAGLTHIVSATPNTTIFEIISVEFQRPHFELIAKWKGLEYHAMHLWKSRADPTAVIEKLKEILKSRGC